MKTYIKPTIKTRAIAVENSILAAVSGTGFVNNIQDITTTTGTITSQGSILGKKNLFDNTWDEEEQ